jgi:hypothetical protein
MPLRCSADDGWLHSAATCAYPACPVAVVRPTRKTGVIVANDDNNDPVETYAALLITGDPNGKVARIFRTVKDLTKEEFDRYSAAYRTLEDILITNMFAYFLTSAKTFIANWDSECKAFAESPLPLNGDPDPVITLGFRLRGAVLAVCSALCYHQERTLEEAVHKFGKDSEQHQAVKAVFNELYDDYFGYRFLARLRNVLIHDTMMAVGMEISAWANKGNPLALIEVNMDRGALIDSDKINATLTAELEAKPGDPSIIQMLWEVIGPMRRAHRKLLTILNPDLTSVCETVVEFDKIFGGESGVRALVDKQSPEMKPPFKTGFNAWAGQIVLFARSYTTDDWTDATEQTGTNPAGE